MRKLAKAVHKIYSGRMGQGGFTLIELLVVIGILAALAGVTILAVTQFMGKGKCEACKTEIHQCQTAAAAYGVDTSPYLTPCSAYLGKTLLTPLKYGGAWTVDTVTGEVTGADCGSYCPP